MIPKVFFSNNSLKKPFPLCWLSRGALGSHTCNSDAYISVLGRIAHGKQQNTGCWLGKLVRISMSQNLLLAQNPREVAWPPGFWLILSVSVHWPRTLKIFMSFICQSSLLIQPSFQPVSLQEKIPEYICQVSSQNSENRRQMTPLIYFFITSKAITGFSGTHLSSGAQRYWETALWQPHGQQGKWCLHTFLQYLADSI